MTRSEIKRKDLRELTDVTVGTDLEIHILISI